MQRLLLFIAVLTGLVAVVYQGWDMGVYGKSRPMLKGGDDIQYYFWLRSSVVDGDWDFVNDVRETPSLKDAEKSALLDLPRTAANRQPDKYPIGWALASLPFFLIAHGLCLLGPGPADGWQPIYYYCIWAGHLAYTVFGLYLAWCVLRRFMAREAALVGVLAGWLASPLVYYQTARISMAHSAAFVLTAACFELTFRLREGPQRRAAWALLALAATLLVETRPTSIVYLLYPAWIIFCICREASRTNQRVFDRLGLFALVGLTVGCIQLIAWHTVYGSWSPDTYSGERFFFRDPQLLSVLFSAKHGWFYWHPLLLVGFAAFAWRTVRGGLPLAWLLSAGGIIYLNASWWCWWFASSFGNRAFEGAALFCMAGLGFLWERFERTESLRRMFALSLLLAVCANLLLLNLFLTGRISRQEAVTYSDCYHALIKLVVP